MKRYTGTIIQESIGTRAFNAAHRICQMESNANSENFGYIKENGQIRFIFTEAALNDTGALQLRAMVENSNGRQLDEDDTDDDYADDRNTEELQGMKASLANAEAKDDTILTDNTPSQNAPETAEQDANQQNTANPVQSGNAGNEADQQPANVVSDKPSQQPQEAQPQEQPKQVNSRSNIYSNPASFSIASDMDVIYEDLIITEGITDRNHPMFNLRHPVMRQIIQSENPVEECPDAVKELNDAINNSGSSTLQAIFGKNTSKWLTILSPFLARSFKADLESMHAALKFRKKFSAFFTPKGKQAKRQTFVMSKLGKTAAQIMKDILHRNGMQNIVRSRIAINSEDLGNLGSMDTVNYYELSSTGKIDPNSMAGQQKTISVDELRHFYQYVNPYSSAGTYMKMFSFGNSTVESKKNKQDAAAAASANKANNANQNAYRNMLANNQLKYVIFAPNTRLHEYDMISNGILKGNGENYHALTIRTGFGATVGFYTDQEISARFN